MLWTHTGGFWRQTSSSRFTCSSGSSHLADECPFCWPLAVKTRHPRIYPRVRMQVDQQDQPMIHNLSRVLKRIGIHHLVDDSVSFLGSGGYVWVLLCQQASSGTRCSPRFNPCISSYMKHLPLHATVHLRNANATLDDFEAATAEAHKSAHYTRTRHVFFDKHSFKLTILAGQSCRRLPRAVGN